MNNLEALNIVGGVILWILTSVSWVTFFVRLLLFMKSEETDHKRVLNIILLVCFFVMAVLGTGKILIENKVRDLEVYRKNTLPKFEAYIARSTKTGENLIIFDAINDIPFEATWVLVTKENLIVSGLMLAHQKIFFNKKKKRISSPVDIQVNNVKDNYVELRVDYRSVFSSESNNPASLEGKIVKKYKYLDGGFIPLE